MLLPSLLASLSWNGTRVGPTAAVERAHSDRARSGSKGSARVSFRSSFRVRTILIVAGRAVLRRKDNKDDHADEWNAVDKDPPTAAVSVMKPPHRHGYAWNQDGQRVDAAQQT